MHIGFITSHFPFKDAASVGGIGTSIKNLGVELVRAGQQVSVFVYNQMDETESSEEGVKIYKIKRTESTFFTWLKNKKNLQRKIHAVDRLNKIHIIEAPDWTGITSFMHFIMPLVIRFHGSDGYFCHLENRKQKLKNFFFEKIALSKANGFISPTTFAGKLTSEIFKIRKPIKTIHYGLSLSQFQNPDPDQYETGLLLYVGAIIRKKGVLELPGIFQKILQDFPAARLLLIGSDSYDLQSNSSSTWELIQNELDCNTKTKVSFIGNVPYDEIQRYIQKAHVCLFPTYAETLGMVTIECMAMGKPVVNSDIGWSQELIDNGQNGFLVHPKNHSEFAARTVAILKDDALRKRISTGAVLKVRDQFDIKQIVKQNINFYTNLLNCSE